MTSQPLQTLGVAILAGGLGTRLQPVVADRPKVLAAVRDRPFLTLLLDQLSAEGIDDVLLLVGHAADRVRDALGDSYRDMTLRYSVEQSPLGTAGALRFALDQLPDDITLILNGDSYCEFDLEEFRSFHASSPASGSLLLAEVDDVSRFGRVELTSDSRVEQFVEKGASGGLGWINAGVYLLPKILLSEIPAGRFVSLEKELFPEWVARGQLRGYRTARRFIDIGTPDSYATAERFFAPR